MKAVIDAGDHFYLKRSGKFDSMPACWNNLEETQHHEISTLIASFYNDLRGDSNKAGVVLLSRSVLSPYEYVSLDKVMTRA